MVRPLGVGEGRRLIFHSGQNRLGSWSRAKISMCQKRIIEIAKISGAVVPKKGVAGAAAMGDPGGSGPRFGAVWGFAPAPHFPLAPPLCQPLFFRKNQEIQSHASRERTMNKTETKYCTRDDAATLTQAAGTRVRVGERSGIIRFDASFGVIVPSDQLAVYVDFASASDAGPEASEGAQRVIDRLFPPSPLSSLHRPTESGGTGLAALGCILFFGALATIVICWISYAYNKFQVNNHPWGTFFSGGENLSKMGYNFLHRGLASRRLSSSLASSDLSFSAYPTRRSNRRLQWSGGTVSQRTR